MAAGSRSARTRQKSSSTGTSLSGRHRARAASACNARRKGVRRCRAGPCRATKYSARNVGDTSVGERQRRFLCVDVAPAILDDIDDRPRIGRRTACRHTPVPGSLPLSRPAVAGFTRPTLVWGRGSTCGCSVTLPTPSAAPSVAGPNLLLFGETFGRVRAQLRGVRQGLYPPWQLNQLRSSWLPSLTQRRRDVRYIPNCGQVRSRSVEQLPVGRQISRRRVDPVTRDRRWSSDSGAAGSCPQRARAAQGSHVLSLGSAQSRLDATEDCDLVAVDRRHAIKLRYSVLDGAGVHEEMCACGWASVGSSTDAYARALAEQHLLLSGRRRRSRAAATEVTVARVRGIRSLGADQGEARNDTPTR